MLTAILFTRAMLGVLAGFAFFNKPAFMGVRAGQIETEVAAESRVAASRQRRHSTATAPVGAATATATATAGTASAATSPSADADAQTAAQRRSAEARGAAASIYVPQQEEKAPVAAVNLIRKIYSFDYMGHKKWWFTISAIIIGAGLISLFVKGGGNPVQGLNYGLEFKEGTRIAVAFDGAADPRGGPHGHEPGRLLGRPAPGDPQRGRLEPAGLPDPD